MWEPTSVLGSDLSMRQVVKQTTQFCLDKMCAASDELYA